MPGGPAWRARRRRSREPPSGEWSSRRSREGRAERRVPCCAGPATGGSHIRRSATPAWIRTTAGPSALPGLVVGDARGSGCHRAPRFACRVVIVQASKRDRGDTATALLGGSQAGHRTRMPETQEHAEKDRYARGEAQGPMEDALEEAFDRQVREGTQRLGRPWREVLVTGFFGGTEVAVGVLALVAVVHETRQPVDAGAASRSPSASSRCCWGRSELFTEGLPHPGADGRGLGQTGPGCGSLGVNAQTVRSGTHYATAPLSRRDLLRSRPGRGGVITPMTRMQHGTDEMVGQDRGRRRRSVPAWPGWRCSTRSWTRC